jgi:outer membrane receptor protein involved in Fe transport
MIVKNNSGADSSQTSRERIPGNAAALAALLVVGAWAPAARAADAATSGPATAPSELDEITVTATRREQSLDTVPISVTAFSQATMDEQGIKGIDDVSRFTPGLTFAPSKAGYISDIAIRGVLSEVGASTTGVYIDDTPVQVRSKGVVTENAFPQIFDLERVEVLKGPQGTLFGTGSMGGTVRFITPEPDLHKYSVYARAEGSTTAGGDPSYEMGAAAGGPVVDGTLGFRASAFYQRSGGFTNRLPFDSGTITDKAINFVDTTVLRAAVKWQPLDQLTITPAIYYQKKSRDNDDYYWLDESDPGAGHFNNGYTEPTPSRDTFTLPSVKVDWQMQGMELISDTSFFYRDLTKSEDYTEFLWTALVGDGSPTPDSLLPNYRANSLFHVRQNSFVQEVRLQSSDSNNPLQWVVGALYQNSRLYADQYVVDPLLPTLSLAAYGVPIEDAFGEGLVDGVYSYAIHQWATDKQTALFGQVDYSFTANWKATLGVRVARDTLDYHRDENGPLTASAAYIQEQGSAPATTPVTPKIGVSYEGSAHDLYYFSASKGTREGGVNNPSVASGKPGCPAGVTAPLVYGADNLWSYELGAKNRFLDGRLRTEASIFYIDWKKIQQNVNNNGCLTTSYTDNLGTATVKGAELQAELRVLDNWSWLVTGGYTDAKFSSDALGSPESDTGIRPVIASEGDSLGVAPWNVGLSTRLDFKAFNLDSYLRVDYTYTAKDTGLTPARDPRNGTVYDPELTADPAVRQLGARLGTKIAGMDISLFARNILNDTPPLGLYHDNLGDPLFYGLTVRPRTVGLTFTYRY